MYRWERKYPQNCYTGNQDSREMEFCWRPINFEFFRIFEKKFLYNQSWQIHICGQSQLNFQIVKILLEILNKVDEKSDGTHPKKNWFSIQNWLVLQSSQDRFSVINWTAMFSRYMWTRDSRFKIFNETNLKMSFLVR